MPGEFSMVQLPQYFLSLCYHCAWMCSKEQVKQHLNLKFQGHVFRTLLETTHSVHRIEVK